MKVKMFQMNCGESILAYIHNECLLIDCGSHSKPAISNPLFDNVISTCIEYDKRQAMITHFHKDHINGFMYITDPSTPGYITFEKVYIPYLFTVDNGLSPTDYFLICDYLEHRLCPAPYGTFTLLDLLERLVNQKMQFTMLKRGDHFQSCNSDNEVLWPKPKHFSSYMTKKGIIDELPQDFIDQVKQISESVVEVYQLAADNLDRNVITPIIAELTRRINEFNDADFQIDSKALLRKARMQLKRADNNTSIVFQTNIACNYLLTGDVNKQTLDDIVHCSFTDQLKLHSKFFAVKAPHHGTSTHYSPALFGSSSTIQIDVVFISNGKHGGTGVITGKYPNNIKHRLICTNKSPVKCVIPSLCTKGCCPLKNNTISNDYFDII